ncbi:MAG: hypothetical protein CL917_06330 [Deltaproteobacteria bacterium]|nr:hypothetical protein [Deltaproteobacteria bacterium]
MDHRADRIASWHESLPYFLKFLRFRGYGHSVIEEALAGFLKSPQGPESPLEQEGRLDDLK